MSTPEEKTTLTTMEQLKPPQSDHMPQVAMGFSNLQSFELMQRAAKLLASSSLVPKNYQGNLANCVIALNMSQRIGADPLLVMQNLYVVHGRPAWSAQFTIACFNQCGRFSAMRYEWFGKEGTDDWGCYAWATETATGETIQGPKITIELAKREGWYAKDGSKWKTIPELMLMYRAGAWLTRTHAPEITMGLLTAEEMHDVYDARKGEDGRYEVSLDSLRENGGNGNAEPSIEPEADAAPEPEGDGPPSEAVLFAQLDEVIAHPGKYSFEAINELAALSDAISAERKDEFSGKLKQAHAALKGGEKPAQAPDDQDVQNSFFES